METLSAKLIGTRRHLLEKGGAFFSAGAAFARAARSEARGWARYLRTRRLGGVRPDLERRVLSRMDVALSSVGQRVRARLGELRVGPRLGAAPAPRRTAVKARQRRARRARA